MKRKKHRGNWSIIFLCCTLAVPTVAMMMGAYGGAELTLELVKPALVTGALLGVAHLFLRPLLRLVSVPLGCLTLGLFGLVIDVGLIYACDRLVEGFSVPNLLYAVLTAVLINTVCAIAGSRH